MKKKTKVVRFIKNKLKNSEGLLIWFETSMSRVNFHILTEMDERHKERYLATYDESNPTTGFRGCHSSTARWTYKHWRRRYKRRFDTAGFQFTEADIVLNDNNETIESLAWLLLHELGHHMVNKYSNYPWFLLLDLLNDYDKTRYEEANPGEKYWNNYLSNDKVHEDRPEEQFCNLIATAIIGKSLDRYWWRENRYQKGGCLTHENK